MNQSETIEKLAEALAKAQGQIEGAGKNKQNPHLKSKYADLASAWDACRAPLSENGLSIVQFTEGGPADVTVTTRLIHSSGQWLESSLTVRATKPDAQGLGSAITYGRRYSLMAMVGIAPEDDDGQAACQPAEQAARPASKPPQQRPTSIQAGGPPPEQAQSTEEEIKKSLVAQISNLAGIAKLTKPQLFKIIGVHAANASVDELDAGKVSLVAFNNRFLNKQLTPDDKILLGLEPGELAAAS